jgi:hypothetical protein
MNISKDTTQIWRLQSEAGENGDIEKALSYFDEACEWRLVTSKKLYRGRGEIRNFMQGGFGSAVVKTPELVTEFASDE